MAVKRIVTPNRFIYATGDTLPTMATDTRVRVGDTAYCKDTGILYITYDGTNWVEKDTIVRLEASADIDIGDVTVLFGGNVYSKTMTMTDDNATRFETTAKKLRDVIIIVTTNNMLLGETSVEVYPVDAEDTIGFTKVDVSTLYFKNASAGSNGTITILGVEE